MEQSLSTELPSPPPALPGLPAETAPERGRPAGSTGTNGVVGAVGEEGFTALREKQLVLIDSLINWMLANPGKPFTHAAQVLGFSAAWLRTVASSDAFQQRMAEKQKDFDVQLMIPTLAQKLTGVAKLAVEQLERQIEVSGDPAFLLDATEMLLKTQGAGIGIQAPSGPTFQVDQMTLVIAEERAKMLGAQSAPKLLEGKHEQIAS